MPAPVQTGPMLDPAAYPTGAPPLTARAWHKSRRRARLELERSERAQRATTEHLRARTRLALVQQGAVVGPEAIAQQAVMDAEQRVTATRERSSSALRPPLRRGIPRFINASRNAAGHQQRLRRGGHWNYKPGMDVPPGVSSPAPAMAREVARRNEALVVNPEGYAVAVPLPNNAVPPRELRLDVPADEVLDFDELLRRGFQVYQSPQNDTVAVWPALDTPDVHWIDPGTPQARPDLVRVRRQLEQRGVLKRQQSSYQSRQQRVSRVSRTRSVAGRNNSRSARRTTREEQR